jgi:xylan 1,4-beta-xylosidase
MTLSGQSHEPLIENTTIEGRHGPIALRTYTPPDLTSGGAAPLVWVHGGAFCWGGLDQPESHAVAGVVAGTGRTVVTVDYHRVSAWNWFRKPKPGVLPGVRFPVPLDDVTDAFTWARELSSDGRVVLGGASAGACLAAATTLRLRDEGRLGPTRLVLAYGTLHAALPLPSAQLVARIRGHHRFLQIQAATVDRMNRNYAGSPEAMADPHAFPGGRGVHDFPPTLVLDADRDSLRASGEAFAAELDAARVAVEHRVVPDSRHGFFERPKRRHFRVGIDILVEWLGNGGRHDRNPGGGDLTEQARRPTS